MTEGDGLQVSFPAFADRRFWRWPRGTASFDASTVTWVPKGASSGDPASRRIEVASIRQIAIDATIGNKLSIELFGDFGSFELLAGSKLFLWREEVARRLVMTWLASVGFERFRRPNKSRFGYGRLFLYARREADIDWEASESA